MRTLYGNESVMELNMKVESMLRRELNYAKDGKIKKDGGRQEQLLSFEFSHERTGERKDK